MVSVPSFYFVASPFGTSVCLCPISCGKIIPRESARYSILQEYPQGEMHWKGIRKWEKNIRIIIVLWESLHKDVDASISNSTSLIRVLITKSLLRMNSTRAIYPSNLRIMGNTNEFLVKTVLDKGTLLLCNPYPFTNRYIG